MSLYHLTMIIGSRSKGKNVIESAAYIAGLRLYNIETGLHEDGREDNFRVVHSEVALCANAPEMYRDRETLWQAVQLIERSCNAQLWRGVEVALPREMTREQHIEAVRKFVKVFTDAGMCTDWSLHDRGDGNPHAHIMLTMRPIKKNGKWGCKKRAEWKLDEEGNRIPIIDPLTGEQKVDGRNRKQWERIYINSTDWNERYKIEEWRKAWADICNEYLDDEHKIDHRSYERQGLNIIPTIHEGYRARDIEAKGGISERCQMNREIMKFRNDADDYMKIYYAVKTHNIEWLTSILDRLDNNHKQLLERQRAEIENQKITGQYWKGFEDILASTKTDKTDYTVQSGTIFKSVKHDHLAKISVSNAVNDLVQFSETTIFGTRMGMTMRRSEFEEKLKRDGYTFAEQIIIPQPQQSVETSPKSPKVTASPPETEQEKIITPQPEPERAASSTQIIQKQPERKKETSVPDWVNNLTYEDDMFMRDLWVKSAPDHAKKTRAKTLCDKFRAEYGLEPLYFNRERDRNAPSGR